MIKRKILIPALAAAVTLFVGCSPRIQNPAAGPKVAQAPQAPVAGPGQPGAKAFDLTGQTFQGKPVRLSDYRGRIVLLNFFSPG